MHGFQVLIIAGLLSAFILAGCVDDAEPPEIVDEPEPTGPRSLSELTCDFTYPDNETQVQCENQFQELSLIGANPPGTATSTVESQEPWVCVEQAREGQPVSYGYSIHWDPQTERYGMYYQFDDIDRPLDAILYNEDGGVGSVLYGAEPSGFILLPELPNSGPPEMLTSLTFVFYIHDYVTDTAELQDGEIRALWSFWEGTPYPVHEITTGNESYYLHNVSVGKGEAGSSIYKMQTFAMDGEDYNITVQYSEVKRLPIGWNPRPYFCTLT